MTGGDTGMDDPILAADEALLVAARGIGGAAGLHRYRQTGTGWQGGPIAPADGLAALARHPALPVVYAAAGGATEDGRLLAWRLDAAGATPLGPSGGIGPSGGVEPCALAVAPDGRALVVTNYASGTLALQRLGADGSFDGPPQALALHGTGPDPERQEAAHPHHAVFDGDALRVIDLGADRLRSFRADLSGGFRPLDDEPLPPGTGPRHGIRLGDGRLAITGELSATLVLGRPGAGDWRSAPGSRRSGPARTRSARNYPGDLTLDPVSGQVLFANRGHDTIARFDVAGPEPRLIDERDAGVAWPQHLLVHRGHLLIAGWDSGQVAALNLPPAMTAVPRPILACPGACWLAIQTGFRPG